MEMMEMEVNPRPMEALQTNKKSILVFQGGTCFEGNTLIQTEKGYKKIKDISNQERVLSFNEKKNKLVFSKVIEKFIYEGEHTLIVIKTKNGIIKCTPNHKFYSEGQWISAKELVRRSLERNKKYKWKLSDKQFWEIKDYELEENQKRKIDAPCKLQRIFKNDNNDKQKTNNCEHSQISSQNISPQFREQKGSKSYRWNKIKQLCRKFRVGNSCRKFKACLFDGINKTKKRRIKWDEQINRETSKRNKEKIQTESIHGKNIGKRLWGVIIHNKRYSLQKKDLETSELKPSEIVSYKLIKVNKIYDLKVKNTENYCVTKKNYVVHNSSGKTYSILNYIILNCFDKWENKTIDIIRRTYPALRISVMKDFFDIIKKMGLYTKDNHNKSEGTYYLGTNLIRFYSSDDEQKVRGPRRHIVFFNEVLEFKKMDVMQILMRTHEQVFMDYNPSEEFHWLYEDILTRDDVFFYKSTYKDNLFLTDKTINEIKRLEKVDKNLWRIYGLGERGVTQATIFSNWDYLNDYSKSEGEELFGLDFGYNDPTALIRVKYHEKEISCDELIYCSELTSEQIILRMDRLVEQKKLTKDSTIFADSARPEIIEEIKRAGYNVHSVKKGKDSVLRGINFLKKHPIKITKESINLVKEVRTYKWKLDKEDHLLDVPIDLNNHLIDALRYAVSEKSRNKKVAGFGSARII